MNNNHRITLNTNKNIIVEFTNERIIPASGLAVVGALLGKSGFIKKLNRMDVTSNRSQHQIKNGDIVLTYLGMLCMGKPYFEAVHEMDDDRDFYKAALGITRSIPSEETLRQRMDDIGASLRQTILEQFADGSHIPHSHSRHLFKYIKIGKIGNSGITNNRNINQSFFFFVKPFRQAVLVFQCQIHVGNYPCNFYISFFFQHLYARVQNGFVSPEFIDN